MSNTQDSSEERAGADRAGGANGVAQRRRQAALAGHTGDRGTAWRMLTDGAPTVRATALGALARLGTVSTTEIEAALSDPVPAVRRRACEIAAGALRADPHLTTAVLARLDDPDPQVAEAAAWALGERAAIETVVIEALAAMATDHDDPLCREAAVAALGAIGDDRGLSAILAACGDRPAVRRRAVLALAPFEGPEVDAALQKAQHDRDWQVRQAAEDLLGPASPPSPPPSE
jgi:HEAT repeat protein